MRNTFQYLKLLRVISYGSLWFKLVFLRNSTIFEGIAPCFIILSRLFVSLCLRQRLTSYKMDRFKIRMAEVSCSDNISFYYYVILQIETRLDRKPLNFLSGQLFWAKPKCTMNTTRNTTTSSTTTISRKFSLGVKLMWPFVQTVWRRKTY